MGLRFANCRLVVWHINKNEILSQVHCENLLFSDINAENACDMLIMADRCAENLKKFVANYIHNNAKAIKESETGRKYINQGNLLVLKALAGISF